MLIDVHAPSVYGSWPCATHKHKAGKDIRNGIDGSVSLTLAPQFSHCTSINMCMHRNDSDGTGALNSMDWAIVNIHVHVATVYVHILQSHIHVPSLKVCVESANLKVCAESANLKVCVESANLKVCVESAIEYYSLIVNIYCTHSHV